LQTGGAPGTATLLRRYNHDATIDSPLGLLNVKTVSIAKL